MRLSDALIKLNEKEEYPCCGIISKRFYNPFTDTYLNIELICSISSESEWKDFEKYMGEDDFKPLVDKALKTNGIDGRKLDNFNQFPDYLMTRKIWKESKERIPKKTNTTLQIRDIDKKVDSNAFFSRIHGFDRAKSNIQKFLEKYVTDVSNKKLKNTSLFYKVQKLESNPTNPIENIEVYKKGSDVMIALVFKSKTESYAKKYLEKFAYYNNMIIKNIKTYEEGDYKGDWVSAEANVVFCL